MPVLRFLQFLLKYLVVPVVVAILFTIAEGRIPFIHWVTFGFTTALRGAIWLIADLRNREPDYQLMSYITNQFSIAAVGGLLGLVFGRLLSFRAYRARRALAARRDWYR